MRNLAMAPAIRPNTAHNRMPTVDLPFAVADFRDDLAAHPDLERRTELARTPAQPAAHRALGRGGLGRVVATVRPQRVADRLESGGERLVIIVAVTVGAPLPDGGRDLGAGVAVGGGRADWRCPAGAVFLGVLVT
jgi:hypothetical protein